MESVNDVNCQATLIGLQCIAIKIKICIWNRCTYNDMYDLKLELK